LLSAVTSKATFFLLQIEYCKVSNENVLVYALHCYLAQSTFILLSGMFKVKTTFLPVSSNLLNGHK